jgi:cytosine/adenosine deaminase-related metal-dependent hydrolase
MPTELLIRNVRPLERAAVDVRITDGLISEVGAGLEAQPDVTVIDGGGRLLVPGFVDAHTHLDKTLYGRPWHRHQAGPSLMDKIENERRLRRELRLDPAEQSANQIRLALSKGTTHIRTHIDIDTESGLNNLHGVMTTRERSRDRLTMQLVAFPQSGLLPRPGTLELLDEALRLGAEVVGGLDPSSIDRDPAAHLDAVFGLAERHGVEVDVHLHEPGLLGAFSVELIAERTRALGMQGKVTISHAFCLGMVDDAYLSRLIELLLENRIAIMTHAPGASPFPPIKRLRAAGVVICSGSDGIRDTWGPYGNADMLERAMLLGYRSNFRRDDDVELVFEIVTQGGATVMHADGYGLAVGCRADCVLLDGETLVEAVVARPPRALVLANGRVVARDGVYVGD